MAARREVQRANLREFRQSAQILPLELWIGLCAESAAEFWQVGGWSNDCSCHLMRWLGHSALADFTQILPEAIRPFVRQGKFVPGFLAAVTGPGIRRSDDFDQCGFSLSRDRSIGRNWLGRCANIDRTCGAKHGAGDFDCGPEFA